MWCIIQVNKYRVNGNLSILTNRISKSLGDKVDAKPEVSVNEMPTFNKFRIFSASFDKVSGPMVVVDTVVVVVVWVVVLIIDAKKVIKIRFSHKISSKIQITSNRSSVL